MVGTVGGRTSRGSKRYLWHEPPIEPALHPRHVARSRGAPEAPHLAKSRPRRSPVGRRMPMGCCLRAGTEGQSARVHWTVESASAAPAAHQERSRRRQAPTAGTRRHRPVHGRRADIIAAWSRPCAPVRATSPVAAGCRRPRVAEKPRRAARARGPAHAGVAAYRSAGAAAEWSMRSRPCVRPRTCARPRRSGGHRISPRSRRVARARGWVPADLALPSCRHRRADA